MEILALIALTLAAIPAAMFLWNLPQLRPPTISATKGQPDIAALSPTALSVLIPARNEAANIRGALTSVLANQGVDFEVVVLDDHSTDGTAEIVRAFATADARVRIETAPPLPPGWCGKQHACHILSQHARHPLLVFVDADVRLAPEALTAFATLFGPHQTLSHMRQSLVGDS